MMCDVNTIYGGSEAWYCGWAGGVAVDGFFYPLETIKTRIMGSSPGQNLAMIARSKFRGFSCQMVVSFPYSFAFFYTYETTRALLGAHVLSDVVASVFAEVAGNLVRNPFEIVKQQLMVGRSERIAHSLRQIWREKGFKGYYIGLQSTLARDILFSAIQLPLFEYFRTKNYFELSTVSAASVAGAMAAAIAGFFSCPLDVIKTRLMTQDFKAGRAGDIVKTIYGESGLRGFFKGVGFRCGILTFGGVVYFGALQKCRVLLGVSDRLADELYMRVQ